MPNPEWFQRSMIEIQRPRRNRAWKCGVSEIRPTDAFSELRDDSGAGAGWDVSIFEGDELLLSRRCGTETQARYCPEAMRQDTARGGWVKAEKH